MHDDDVRHVAALARLALPPERVSVIAGELNRILEHMAVLEQVNTLQVRGAAGVGDTGMPLRVDSGPQLPLARSRDSFAPELRDGFLIVPRLATHESAGSGAPAAADEELA